MPTYVCLLNVYLKGGGHGHFHIAFFGTNV